jgi:hypothetical protein
MPWMIFPALLYFFQPMASFYLFQLNRNIVSITRIEIFDFFQRWIKQRNFPFRFNPQSLSVNKTLHPYMHQNALMKCPLYQNKYSSRQHCIHKELLFTANLNQLGKSKKQEPRDVCFFVDYYMVTIERSVQTFSVPDKFKNSSFACCYPTNRNRVLVKDSTRYPSNKKTSKWKRANAYNICVCMTSKFSTWIQQNP